MNEDDQIAFAKRLRGGADAPKASAAPRQMTPDESQSVMRSVGMWGFWLSLAALAIGILMAVLGSGLGVVTVLLGSGVGLFAFMWMLGAIEMRLIQINDTLKSQGKADA
ncbi:MAG: hypothetical protein Q8K90_08045 [Brevundimonas sp.]|nr:hypothetical protein [Brevundimonas sp.]